jgi:DnaJ-class molecular chaperone
MKSALLIFAILTAQPAGLREKPEVECVACCGDGWRVGFMQFVWLRIPAIERCGKCDGYGKERTIYGQLLKPK